MFTLQNLKIGHVSYWLNGTPFNKDCYHNSNITSKGFKNLEKNGIIKELYIHVLSYNLSDDIKKLL